MEPHDAFDVVVVGGGAAGCVVAARVAQYSRASVVLLEAGPDLRAHVSDAFRDGWHMSPDCDWGYAAEPNESGVAEDLRRGKLVGGTSWVTRFAMRGSPGDYEEWAAAGNPGWGFDDVLPYFRRLESDAEFGDRPWHGDGGPIPITRYPQLDLSDICAAGQSAAEAAGFAVVEDHNRPGASGVGRMPMSSRDGNRVTTADAYLPLATTPDHLTVRGDAHVANVMFEGTRATGVRLVDGSAISGGWVVLCAGTYGSPAILMRSGVGPSDHLREMGIGTHVDLPGVGANLADHPGADIECGFRGPARSQPILHVAATFRSSGRSESDGPDLMLWMSDPRRPVEGQMVFSVDVVLLKPDSRGSVRLHSSDPTAPPLIELPGLREQSDVDRLVEGFRRGLDVAMRPEIRRLCASVPAAASTRFDDLSDLVRAQLGSYPHVVGTCAMGARPEDGAVVDADGRVHGTERLFVVDASIIPNGPSAFTHLPVIMLAERLSERFAVTM